jgi:hypothetical protein
MVGISTFSWRLWMGQVGSSTHHGFYVSSMLFNDTLKTQRISLIKAILEVRTSIRLTNLQFSITTL